jgi:hypothetical protein
MTLRIANRGLRIQLRIGDCGFNWGLGIADSIGDCGFNADWGLRILVRIGDGGFYCGLSRSDSGSVRAWQRDPNSHSAIVNRIRNLQFATRNVIV